MASLDLRALESRSYSNMVAAPLKKTKQQMMGSTWLALDKIERRTPESVNTQWNTASPFAMLDTGTKQDSYYSDRTVFSQELAISKLSMIGLQICSYTYRDSIARIQAWWRLLARSLGGCTPPPPSELERCRCPYRLSNSFETGKSWSRGAIWQMHSITRTSHRCRYYAQPFQKWEAKTWYLCSFLCHMDRTNRMHSSSTYWRTR